MKGFLGLLLAMSWALPSAQAATTFCVGDVAHLSSALVHAKNASDTTIIQLVQGTYNVAGSEITAADITNPYNAVQLLGGYDGTCANRTLIPALTVIDGGGQGVALFMQGSLTIEGIHFQNTSVFTRTYQVDSTTTRVRNNEFPGVSLSVNHMCSDNGQIDIDNNLSYGAGGNGLYAGAWCVDSGTGTGTHTIDTVSINLTNNTAANNSGAGIYIDSSSVQKTTLYNNIVWSNGQYDIYLRSGQRTHAPYTPGVAYYVSNNLYDNGGVFAGTGTTYSNNVTGDPLFANAAGGDYHLTTPSSPAINAGNPSAPSQPAIDLDGNPRVVGSAPDIGAYETNVNDLASATLTVINTNDSGAGSLRQAIIDANASSGSHYIEFNIAGNCPQVISLASDLPYITLPSLSINGFTQPGSQKNTVSSGLDFAKRCIVLDGQGRANSMGLTFSGASSGFYWVQGLAFEGWDTALNLSAGQNNLVWGNQFGGTLNYNAQSLTPNGIDIWLCGGTTTTNVGGTDPSNRNTIGSANGSQAGYGGRGIALSSGCGSGGNSIVNNLIGFDWNEGAGTGGNAVGIQLETANNVISGNVIGNNNNGIQALGSGAYYNKIHDNLIGLTEPPICVIGPCPAYNNAPNQAGIYFWQGANSNFVYSNTITNNTLFGIEMTGSGTYQNDVYANSIFGNPASWATAGAEVNLDGYAYGYNDPSSTAPNRGLNAPIIDSVAGSGSTGTIAGHLASSNGTYLIEVFSSPTCEAGGAYAHSPFGSASVSGGSTGTNGTGGFYFDFTSPPSLSLSGRYITVTAIDSSHNSSEFSACKLYQCDVIFRDGFEGTPGEKCP